MSNDRRVNIADKMVVFATIIYFVLIDAISIFVGGEGNRTGGMILIGQLLIVVFFFLFHTKFKIGLKLTTYHFYFVLFIVYCFVNCLWAVYPNSALARTEQLAEIAIVMVVLFAIFSQRENAVDDLLTVIMIGGLLLVALYIVYYGWSYIVFSLRNSDRISSELINANTLGMAASYSCVIFFHRLMQKRIRVWWIPFVVLSFVTILVSQSRKAFLILVVGLLGIFILNNYKDKNLLRTIRRIIIAIIAIALLFFILEQTGASSGIIDRLHGLMNSIFGGGEIDKSTSMRNAFLSIGVNLFKENPIGGVGIDCARYFTSSLYGYNYHLHNNYVELLADGGVIGLIVYYWLYVHILFSMIKHRDFADPEFNICFVILVLRIIMDYGFYSYKEQNTYFFFLLICLYYRKHNDERRLAVSGKRIEEVGL